MIRGCKGKGRSKAPCEGVLYRSFKYHNARAPRRLRMVQTRLSEQELRGQLRLLEHSATEVDIAI